MNQQRLFLKIYLFAIILLFESFFMSWAVLISLFQGEEIIIPIFKAFFITLFVGISCFLISYKHKRTKATKKDYMFIVVVSWLILAFFGTFPYIFSGAIPNFVDAFFESMSGFSTTGSSIVTDIESLPKSVLFWRSLTHWIGGMGIIVLVLAIVPFQNINYRQMFQSETSVFVEDKMSYQIKYIARNIWLIYVGLTVLETIFLLFGGMGLFDAVCHSFGTIATGGFSTKNDSIAGFSPYIQYVIIVFMLIAGINFNLHILVRLGKLIPVLRNEELRLYFKIIGIVGFALTLILHFQKNLQWEQAFRDSFFQVSSIITATGFASADYLAWPIQGILLIMFLMLIGACAGSTGGGVKVIRYLFVIKKIKEVFRKITNPNAICEIRYNHHTMKSEVVSSILSFILIYYMVIAFGTLFLRLTGLDLASAFGASITTLGGIGPGFGSVGPVSNFAHLSDLAKMFLTFNMLAGRLEIYALLLMFSPGFWKS